MSTDDMEDELDVRIMSSSRDLDDYDILQTKLVSAAVPHKTTASFRKYIWAAMVTYSLGNTSIDHVMRRYESAWQRFKEHAFEANPRVLILRELVEEVSGIADRLEQVAPDESLGFICSKSALCRLEASFKSAYGLIRKDYIFESDAVVRLILEQLAWCYSAYGSDDQTVEALSPTKCVSRFKTFFEDAGVLYGQLSEWAHIDPSIVSNYVRFHKSQMPVVRRSRENSLQSGQHLVALAIVYARLVQFIFSTHGLHEHEELLGRLGEKYDNYLELMLDIDQANS